MTQSAVVTKIINNTIAEISVTRQSACGENCASCGGGCASNMKMTTTALNNVSARVGDKVTVSTRSSKIIYAALLVYIFPLIMLFVGYGLSVPLKLAEGGAILMSFAGLILGIALVVIYQRAFGSKKQISFEIISIN